MKTEFLLIGRGLAGWHADGRDGKNPCSSSGGTLEGYVVKAAEGALVYDASNADAHAFTRLVVDGPLVCVMLDPEACDRFQDHGALAAMAPLLGDGFRSMANKALAQGHKWSGFDKIGVGIYERLLREIRGIRIGRVRSGAVVWEET